MSASRDMEYMRQALNLADQGLGRVWPNPSVGCVIVKDRVVIGAARTGDGGRPHAETIALKQAGQEAEGARAYVTFEPCAHHGQTPPCVDALIHAGIKKVFIAVKDPDLRTAGESLEKLKAAGIEVELGLCEKEARALNRGFILRVTQNRPFITLKTATSSDGKIAGGAERWITGEEARRHAHFLRSRHDAILIGVGTALADDPLLTTRLENVNHDIVRIVIDTNLRLHEGSSLVRTARKHPLWLIYNEDREGKTNSLESSGCKLVRSSERSIKTIVSKLAELGITRLLVEGGAQIHTSFIESGLYDEIAWFRAPQPIGAEGLPAFKNVDILEMKQHLPVQLKESHALGQDRLEIYARTD